MANDTIQNTRKKRFILRTWHMVATLVALVVVVAIALSVFFVWDRWDRYNDRQEIQGQWYVFGTAVPIQITEDLLDFNADTAYHYEIDDDTKTITFKLGNLEGTAHYCFFEDRQVLMLIDGKDFERWETASDDLLVALQELVALSSGRIPQYPVGDDIIILSRTPDKFGWGDYNYAYREAPDETGTNGQGSSSGGSTGGSASKPDSSDGTSDDTPPNPNEGKPREDDPFGIISDRLLDEVRAYDEGVAAESGDDSNE